MNKLLIFPLVLAAVAGGAWLGLSTIGNKDPVTPETIQGAIYPQAKIINDFVLQNQNSEKFSKSGFINHWSLIFVGYTHCPDVCPTTLAVMGQIVDIMDEQRQPPPQVVFLTVDPARDTSEVIKPYIAYFNKQFIGLTGSLDEINALSRQLNAVFKKSAKPPGEITDDDYLMDHSSALMLINPEGNLQSILTAPHTPGVIIESILKSQAYYQSLATSQ
ncbi:Cytochrome oxidase biogenesis protein Sco1/SenC/PrrC, thiol-disulfide reductase involved in Cu(I) insertion into CoxII Cu(A) center [hydrothermal vent metagenome]|uniref:Cytochrome oxidase biogenesis protein Sco1/SenC/PrrC, thiol-disulfide reductase involved in Cu(I) insertion into CoxII Cu(A) center n=1 Tax=hydrothermal vent metagenome TaxID=652676 RepID=A0A3B0XZH4_9ZZZZ